MIIFYIFKTVDSISDIPLLLNSAAVQSLNNEEETPEAFKPLHDLLSAVCDTLNEKPELSASGAVCPGNSKRSFPFPKILFCWEEFRRRQCVL